MKSSANADSNTDKVTISVPHAFIVYDLCATKTKQVPRFGEGIGIC